MRLPPTAGPGRARAARSALLPHPLLPLLAAASAAALFAALLAALALAATGCAKDGHSEVPPEARPVAVAVVSVAGEGAPAGALVLPARVKAREEVTLTATVSARLTALPVREGGSFRRGEALARFEAAETQRALEAARAAHEAALLRLDQARLQDTRMDSLYAARVASKREREMAEMELAAAEAAEAQARAALAQWTTGTTLPAPFDGVVVRHRADAGASLNAGEPLLDIRSAEAGEIEVPVPESALSGAREARVAVQIGEGPWREARVERWDGMTDFTTRTRTAYVRLVDGSSGGATPGMPAPEPGAFVRVRFDRARLEELAAARPEGAGRAPEAPPAASAGADPLTVPARSLVRRGALTGVFVVEDGRATLRWLRVGRADGDEVMVLAGLRAGEKIVADPAGLTDGQAVEVGDPARVDSPRTEIAR